MPLVSVVIPVYKPTLDWDEQISLNQCLMILHKHSICICTYHSLDISIYIKIFEKANVKFSIEYFDDSYFNSILGYNRLMLSSEFYERFLTHKYILIYQLDCFVFADDLEYWCGKGYDYIGAPWIRIGYNNWDWKSKVKHRFISIIRKHTSKDLNWDDILNKVGNGGFSLRRVSLFYSIIKKKSNSKKLNKYINPISHFFNEDVFWSYGVDTILFKMYKPNTEEALRFSFEMQLEYSFELCQHNLPFGCHAWARYGIDFWRPFINKFGYNI